MPAQKDRRTQVKPGENQDRAFYRDVRIESLPEKDSDSRTVVMAISSEEPVLTFFHDTGEYGWEILSHENGDIDFSRLNNNGPLLLDHSRDSASQVGALSNGRIGDDKVARIDARFSRGPKADEIFQDVKDGIRGKVSIGYRYPPANRQETGETREGRKVFRVRGWTPFEVSLVTIPADDTVGVGRSEPNQQESKPMAEDNQKPDTGAQTRSEPVPKPDTTQIETKVREEARKGELTRIKEINAVASHFRDRVAGLDADAERYINEGKDVAEFREYVLMEKMAKAVKVPTQSPEIGMSGKEVRNFSVFKAMSEIAEGRGLSGLEKECTETVSKRIGRQPETGGFFIPFDVRSSAFEGGGRRDFMQAGDAELGGNTVATDLRLPMVELLRNNMVMSQLGPQTLSGLVGNVAIPKQTEGGTAYWVSEEGTIPDSTQKVGLITLTPKRLGARTPYTRQFLRQSAIGAEAFVRNDLMQELALAWDLAAFDGTGANGQPRGIMRTPGTNEITFGGAPTWAKIVDFETQVDVRNALTGNIAYVTTPAVRGKWKVTEKAANTAQFIWTGTEVNGYSALTTNQIPTNRVVYGNFNSVILADWEGMEVVVDPYTKAAEGRVVITIQTLVDVGVRYAKSFAISKDSGAQ